MTQISSILNLKLFVGVNLTPTHTAILNKLNPVIRNSFIKTFEDSVYLTQIELDHCCYLGKFVATPFCLKELDSLEKNILSLIHKVLPLEAVDLNHLQLIPIPANE